jgi:c-di-GMP-binding flagellar brake protein YcgR
MRDDQQLMRGFKLEVLRQTNRFFRAVVPGSIFKVQRRKFPRVYTAEGSTLTFAPKDSRRILHAQIIDVSLEGAKIFGNLVGLKQGTALSPITLTLSFDDRRSNDVVVNVSEAVVVREIRVREKVELSFHFQNKNADDLLKKYIDLRILEQEVYG